VVLYCVTGEGGFSCCSPGAKHIPAALCLRWGHPLPAPLPGAAAQVWTGRLAWKPSRWSPPDPWLEQSGCLNQRSVVSFETLTLVGWSCFNSERFSTPCVVSAGMDVGACVLLACKLEGCCGSLPPLPRASSERSSWEPSLQTPAPSPRAPSWPRPRGRCLLCPDCPSQDFLRHMALERPREASSSKSPSSEAAGPLIACSFPIPISCGWLRCPNRGLALLFCTP